eukprot:3931879-Rhodomonas_salina.3
MCAGIRVRGVRTLIPSVMMMRCVLGASERWVEQCVLLMMCWERVQSFLEQAVSLGECRLFSVRSSCVQVQTSGVGGCEKYLACGSVLDIACSFQQHPSSSTYHLASRP